MRPPRRRTLLALAVLLVVQWTIVVLTARRTVADDASLWRVVLTALVLMPVAIACVYLIAAQLGGPRLGVLAAGLWVLVPVALAPLWDARYEPVYEDGFLPMVLGLREDNGFLVMTLLLVAAAVAAALAATDHATWAIAAGVPTAWALAMDGSVVLFAVAPALALAAARRWRALPFYAAAVLPGLIVLLVRDLPLPDWPGGDVWGNLHDNFLGVQEFFWSVRILQWLPVAGVIGVARRSVPLALLLGWWFGAYLLFEGGHPDNTIGAGTFLTALVPALPAYVLLATAVPLLLPPLPAWRPPRPRFLTARR